MSTRSPAWHEFHVRGWTVVRGALDAPTVAGFATSIAEELAAQGARLDDPATWPRGGARRVLECAPLGGAPHWDALLRSSALAAALDDVAGNGTWELPVNSLDAEGKLGTRHWYCPVAFPESPPDAATAAAAAPPSAGGASPCRGPRTAELMACAEEEALRGPVGGAAAAAARWQPVNRRRFLSKGWHIDVGPGFPSAGVRTVAGDPRQGVVVLLVLSDSGHGAGGTAMIPYSHFWAADALDALPAGARHQDLNTAFVAKLRALTEAGRVALPCACVCAAGGGDASGGGGSGSGSDGGGGGSVPPRCHGDARAPECVSVEQVTGAAGDVVLVHPLLLHSGTTNLGTAPRLLANGMARMRDTGAGSGAPHACPLLRALPEARARLAAECGAAGGCGPDCQALDPLAAAGPLVTRRHADDGVAKSAVTAAERAAAISHERFRGF